MPWNHRSGRRSNAERPRLASIRHLQVERLEPRMLLVGDSIVAFNEIMYHPLGNAAGLEWVELYNQHAVNVDLSRWRLSGAVDYEFAEGTVIPGRGYLVVAANPAALQAATGFAGANGPFTGQLANEGEELRLLDNNSRIINTVAYDDGGDWPTGPDGSGVTLAKMEELGSSETPYNWASNGRIGGTPGAQNFSAPPLPTLVFNEVAPASGAAFWLEIANLGPQATVLTGHQLVARDTGSAYTFSGQTIAAGGFLPVTEAQLGFRPTDGERLFLYGPGRTELFDARAVTPRLRGRAPEHGGQWLYPDSATPGAANWVRFQDEIVINEIMFHAPAKWDAAQQAFAESSEEWIELFNRGTSAVDLTGWSLRDAIDFDFPPAAEAIWA